MKSFNKEIVATSILLILNPVANAWADSAGMASSNADSIASSTAIVAVNNNLPATTANATDAATSGSGNAWSDHSAAFGGEAAANNNSTAISDHSIRSTADASSQGAAASGNGIATTLNNDNSDHSQVRAYGTGAVAADNGGSATSSYRVSNQTLSGSVTGNSSVSPIAAASLSSLPAGNNIDHSLIGNAGITQTFQNTGSGLAQQSVAVEGTVTVTQGAASVMP
ncbi:MAG: hypothetical protein ACXWF8_03840 [Methylobacter sp.]